MEAGEEHLPAQKRRRKRKEGTGVPCSAEAAAAAVHRVLSGPREPAAEAAAEAATAAVCRVLAEPREPAAEEPAVEEPAPASPAPLPSLTAWPWGAEAADVHLDTLSADLDVLLAADCEKGRLARRMVRAYAWTKGVGRSLDYAGRLGVRLASAPAATRKALKARLPDSLLKRAKEKLTAARWHCLACGGCKLCCGCTSEESSSSS
jgi:hypothetical protein